MIALYSRVSTREQAVNGFSITAQQESLGAYAKSFGWSPVRYYTDAGFSGSSLQRPAIQELIRDVKAGKISRVVVFKLDRLSRSQKDTLFLIEDVLRPAGCEFVSMSESFSTDSAIGRATVGLLSVFAQLERENIKERSFAGRQVRASAGLFYGGPAPIGYELKNGRLSVVEFEAVQIREFFQMVLRGYSMPEIFREAAARGYSRADGQPWTLQNIRRIMKNPVYGGKVVLSGELYDGIHEAIVDPETYDRVHAILAQREKEWRESSRAIRSTRMLSGLVVCAKCGGRVRGHYMSRRKRAYYYCDGHGRRPDAPRHKEKFIREEILDDAVLAEMEKLTLEPLEGPGRPISSKDEESAMEKQLAAISRQISRLVDLYAVGSLDAELLEQKVQGLNAQAEAIRGRLADLKETAPDRDEIRAAISSLPEAIEEADPVQLRAICRALIQQIELDAENMEMKITWKF